MTMWTALALALVGPVADTPGPCETIVSNSPAPRKQEPLAPAGDIDRYIGCEMKERGIPGVALAISRRGRIVTQRAYGLASVQNDAPVTPRTRFAIASITKPITAVGIMLLVEDGKLDLEAPVSRYLTDAPLEWRRMTVKHLLNHTSGMPGLDAGWSQRTKQQGYDLVRSLSRDRSAEQEYKLARRDPLLFQPGTNWTYSDVGYFLLGVITERVSGMPWRDFVRRRIFTPLGMTDSYVLDQWGIYKDEARLYTIREGVLANARRDLQIETPSYHGIFSNVIDLTKFDAALYTDRLLTAESRRAMWSPTKLPGGVFPYGLGWEVWSWRGHAAQFHGGYTGTELLRLPDDKLTVIVLTNLGATTRLGLAPNIAKMMLPTLKRAPVKPVPIAMDQLRSYAGMYKSIEGASFDVRLEGGRLSAPYPWPFPRKGGRAVLVHRGGHTFEFADHDGRLVFLIGPAGRPTALYGVAWDGGLRSDFARSVAN